MRLYIILLATIFLQSQCKGQKTAINCSPISSAICSYVKDSLPEYNFITKSELDSNTSCQHKTIEQSFCCVSDFDGDGINDYALLLRDKNNKVCLFFFSVINNNVIHHLIDCFGPWKGEITELKVAVEPKGVWESVDDKIEVPFDGILVDDLRESISKAYYWNGDKFVKFLYD